MRPASRRNYVVYLTALSLLLAVVENSLPRPLPFFRLGLANLPLLWALSTLSFRDYLLLALGKWLCGSFVSGTLLSPFALMGLGSTLSSALVMYLLHSVSKGRLSRYLIGQLGAMMSAFAQLYIASFILTESILRLLPVMLVVNEISGLVIAYISYRIEIPEERILDEKQEKGHLSFILILYMLSILSLCMTADPLLLALLFLLSILSCPITGRRIIPSMYLITLFCVVFFNLLVPQGRVLFLFVTQGALEEGTARALRLLSLTALSQSLAASGAISGGYIGSVLELSSSMVSTFYESRGSLMERIERSLTEKPVRREGSKKEQRILPLSLLLASITVLSTLQAVLL